MDKIRLEILGLSSSSQSQSGSFALVLGEEGTNRRLPIIIGMFEAQAIAIEIEKITSSRPMTHDLFKSFASTFEFRVTEIFISDLREGVFYAKIVCKSDHTNQTTEIDARPSDAIAIGLRFGVPIYTNDSVMSEAAITITDSEEQAPTTPRREKASARTSSSSGKASSGQEGSLKSYSAEQLEEMLNEAVAEENYEKAAKIRDELDQRK
ncbi:MAG: bifunctional nuclease family protein [Bernardetiaceae bacterium]|nr:bifunctional nuclease family protein [Bernardetiaceae bacterium]